MIKKNLALLLMQIGIMNASITISLGDITQATTEAIVNAANKELQGGSGVCGAIFKAAGKKSLQNACDLFPCSKDLVRCPTGEARITNSFKLKNKGIKFIIHAVGPDCRVIKNKITQDALLKAAYENSLILADKNSITSISFPFISSAIYAFPKKRAALIALKTTANYLKNNKNSSIKHINFVLFSKEDYSLFLNLRAL